MLFCGLTFLSFSASLSLSAAFNTLLPFQFRLAPPASPHAAVVAYHVGAGVTALAVQGDDHAGSVAGMQFPLSSGNTVSGTRLLHNSTVADHLGEYPVGPISVWGADWPAYLGFNSAATGRTPLLISVDYNISSWYFTVDNVLHMKGQDITFFVCEGMGYGGYIVPRAVYVGRGADDGEGCEVVSLMYGNPPPEKVRAVNA